MEFNSRQAKIIKSKPNGYNMIKGKSKSGKTTTILNRIPFLLKSYCLAENDSILMIVPFEESLKKSERIYNNIESEKYYQESFFEKDTKKHFRINTIEKLAFEYISVSNKEFINEYKIIDELEKKEILLDIIKNIKIKRFDKIENIDFLIQEFKYIKSFNYDLEEY
ncbi:UvrD-helicase domain-containing protein, partial [Clostridium sp.]|uniref:UvrD-helicase domain-containing protein n=1 Tax=Clostridium sp. TaxID=1506 RepID=UPI00290E4815|nr:peptidase [Clostridium sp.]